MAQRVNLFRLAGVNRKGKTLPEFEEVFADLYRVAYRVGFRILGNREDAKDVAQDALARAYVQWGKIASHPNPAGWIGRVSGNLALDTWRKRRRAPARMVDPGPESTDGGERVDLQRALAQLPRRQREVVVLRYIADLPEQVVAQTLGCSVGAVKQHASRGLANLRGGLATQEL